MTPKIPQLDYEPLREVPADPRQMFLYLLPIALFFAAISTFYVIESAANGIDTHNFGGACCIFFLIPFSFWGARAAVSESKRRDGRRVFVRALPLLGAIALAPPVILWLALEFGLFKRFM